MASVHLGDEAASEERDVEGPRHRTIIPGTLGALWARASDGGLTKGRAQRGRAGTEPGFGPRRASADTVAASPGAMTVAEAA